MNDRCRCVTIVACDVEHIMDLQIRVSVQGLRFAILVGGVLGTDEVDLTGLHK